MIVKEKQGHDCGCADKKKEKLVESDCGCSDNKETKTEEKGCCE